MMIPLDRQGEASVTHGTRGKGRTLRLVAGVMLLTGGALTLLVGLVLTFLVPFGFVIGWAPVLAGLLAVMGAFLLFTIRRIHYALIGPIALVAESVLAIWYDWYFFTGQGYVTLPIALAGLCLVALAWHDLQRRAVALYLEGRPIGDHVGH